VTRSCETAVGRWDGEDIVVIDTADIFHLWDGSNEACREITRCIELSSPGPHVLLLVTQLGRFTQEDQEAVRGVQDIFEAGVFRHVVVVFTRGEELVAGSLHDYVTYTDNTALRSLIQSCGHRYCSINNRATGAERDQQVQQLMEKIQQTQTHQTRRRDEKRKQGVKAERLNRSTSPAVTGDEASATTARKSLLKIANRV